MARLKKEERTKFLYERIASEICEAGVCSISRWDVLRVYGRSRFSAPLRDELLEGVNLALNEYAEVSTILSSGWDNNHRLVFIADDLPEFSAVD